MPHRRNVEAAAYLDVPGQVREVDGYHQYVGDALIALGLEVVFGHPEGVVAEPVHGLGDIGCLVIRGYKVVVVETAVVDGGSGIADVSHVNVARVEAVEFGYHFCSPGWDGVCSISSMVGMIEQALCLGKYGGLGSRVFAKSESIGVNDSDRIAANGPDWRGSI